MNFFQLPIGAGPNDPVVGEVDGAQIRRAPNGTKYYSQYRAPAAPAAPSMMTETTLDEQGRAIHNRVPNTTRDQVRAILAGPSAIAGEAVRGLTAPGRALRGEPVTYGDVWATALDYGVGSAPTSAPEGALRSGGIRAYHGSPHDFDRFSMDKIGTGEGAQAYGHGLYFAESEDVARSYRDALAAEVDWSDPRQVAGFYLYSNPSRQQADDLLSGALNTWRNDATRGNAEEALALIRSGEEINWKPPGHMYEVNINANPDDFLDWESGLSGQPQKVKDWFDSRGISEGFAGTQSGNELFQAERRAMGDEALARSMSDSGIAGVRYLDHGSRYNAMDGLGPKTDTRNFVVFDEDLISIVRKYGIAGAAAYLGMPEDEIRQRVGGS